jgi:alpha-tubulin suppressor-like RCC1 family protein
MYVWGVNRNYALGTGDSSDKAWPDRVALLTQRQASEHPDPAQRFYHVGVKDVVMAKLHTGVVTTEARGNVSVCGFGSGGRLGRSVHSQLALLPLPELPHTVVSIALGQDHTLALTSGGYILSWGNSRFCQLGYAVEAPEKPFAKDGDDQVQTSPKRIVGPLKKEFVRGVAAGRMASACWTADDVWTWGTNLGHLGYEKAANPVQVNPRRVPAITQGVMGVTLSVSCDPAT